MTNNFIDNEYEKMCSNCKKKEKRYVEINNNWMKLELDDNVEIFNLAKIQKLALRRTEESIFLRVFRGENNSWTEFNLASEEEGMEILKQFWEELNNKRLTDEQLTKLFDEPPKKTLTTLKDCMKYLEKSKQGQVTENTKLIGISE